MKSVYTLLLSATIATICVIAPAQSYDLLITNGRIYDGSGNPWFHGDIAIAGGRIAAVGELDTAGAEQTIDATGMVVAPGFIDVHTHADDDLYDQPLAENFIRNGVTTIVTGNCGSSERNIGEYLERLDKDKPAPNVITLYGHNTILRAVGDEGGEDLTEEQWTEARQLMHQAMQDGAWGLSTGLIYTPSLYSSTEEVLELQKIASQYGGMYATHMRSEGLEIVSAIEEALQIGMETNSRVQISHFKLGKDMEQRLGVDHTLNMIRQARAQGQEVWIDQYPYAASSTSIRVLFPDWVLEKGSDEAKELLQNPEMVAKVKADMYEYHHNGRLREDMHYAKIASCRAYPEFEGLSLREVAQVRKARAEKGEGLSIEDALADPPAVTMDEQFDVVIDIWLNGSAGMVYHALSENAMRHFLQSPLIAVCSDSSVRTFGRGNPHPRGYGSNARVLGRFVREEGLITMEEAIRKMTSLPATAFRVKQRGTLHEGSWADVVVFDPDTVIDKAEFADPHHYSEGFRAVIVNGVPVVLDDNVTGNRPGMALRGPGYTRKQEAGG